MSARLTKIRRARTKRNTAETAYLEAIREAVQAGEDLKYEIAEAAGVSRPTLYLILSKLRTCEDCQGTGEIVLNPHWPNGTQPYSERCSTCSGTGEADKMKEGP